jgi:peroxiredoxin
MLGPGDAAPELSGSDLILGGTFTLSAHAGEVVIVCFGASWCPHCNAEVPRLQNLWNKHQGHGVQIPFVHEGNTAAAVQAWLTGLGATFHALLDASGTLWSPYATGDTGIPQNFFVGRGQIIHSTLYGAYPEDVIEGHLLDAIYARDPVDLELVMDVSDSMNSPSTGDSKLVMMKQAACMITDFLTDHGQPTDRLGLTWFTDNASDYTSVGGQKLFTIPVNAATLKGQINAHGTGVCTAMGAGLQTAFDTLAGSTQKRFAIVATDGMQNIEPKVTQVGSHFEIIDSGGWLCGPHSSTAAHPGTDLVAYDTGVHPIGIGITATYEPLLQDLANALGGFYRATDDPAADLDLIYFVDLCNCLAGGSPALVHHATGTLGCEEAEAAETFLLNRTARKVTVLLAWPRSLPGGLTFWLYSPDGTPLDLYREMRLFDDHCLATIYLPRTDAGRQVQSVGRWRMVIKGETDAVPAPYHAFVIAEDVETHLHVDFPRKAYEVGDILPIAVALQEQKKPLTAVREIAVETTFHRVPIAELLARVPVSALELPAPRKVGRLKYQKDPLALKLEAVANDPTLARLVKPARETLSMTQGTLACTIGDKAVTLAIPLRHVGLNTFKVCIHAESPGNGPVVRTDLVCVHVGPSKVDPASSKVAVAVVDSRTLKGPLLTVTPRSADGALIGPGFAGEFKALSRDKVIKAEVEDTLDGAYQITVPLQDDAKKGQTAVTLIFQGKVLWKGKV